jgi:alpha-D-ribose 1-methylphosphonate 5-triphosphate synthase subunit PhnL
MVRVIDKKIYELILSTGSEGEQQEVSLLDQFIFEGEQYLVLEKESGSQKKMVFVHLCMNDDGGSIIENIEDESLFERVTDYYFTELGNDRVRGSGK